jgi:hypothetical protein
MTQRLMLFGLAFLAGMAFFGCEATCEYPNVQTFSLRLLNAMPDQPKITIFINGKLFKRDFSYVPPSNFGYTSAYEDGTLLPVGTLSLVVTSDAAGTDTLHKGFITPNLHRQTLIVMGRGKKLLASDTSSTKHLLLDDQDVPEDETVVKIRVVHAISDLPPLDIFFRGIPTDTASLGKPDLTLAYGQASLRISLPSLPGLTVTEAGNPKNVIFSVTTPFDATGFFITAVLRGSSEPCGIEPVPTPLLLADVEEGKVVIDFSVFTTRLVNATKNTTLSLSATNPPPQPQNPRGNIPGQEKVFNIPAGSFSQYFGVGAIAFGSTRWYFFRNFRLDTVFATNLVAKPNERWTFVAYQKPDDTTYYGLTLKDTLVCVPEAYGKVRVVNLSPETGPITVSIDGAAPISLAQGEFRLVGSNSVLTSGSKQVTISSGSLTETHTLVVPPARPISVYILPSKPGQPFPITISSD